MNKTNVLHIVEDLKVGGLEKIIYNLVVGLSKEKYNIFVWCLTQGGKIAEQLIKEGFKVEILGMGKKPSFKFLLDLAKKLNYYDIKIMHAHGYTAATVARVAGIFAGTKIKFVHMHSNYIDFTIKQLFIEKILSFFTDKIICCSKSVQKFVVNNERIDLKKTIVIYNGIEDKKKCCSNEDVKVVKKTLNLSDDTKIVGFVGRLERLKGVNYLIAAAKYIVDNIRDIPNIKYLIVGDGSERNILEQIVKENKLENNFLFLGQQLEIYKYINIMDILVLPSIYREGLGMVILEAMSFEKPVIASNIGGISEVLEDNVNGFLIKPKDSLGIAKAIIELVCDNNKRILMGQNGRKKFLERFTINKMINEIENLYDENIISK